VCECMHIFRASRMGIRPERARLNNSFSIAEKVRKNPVGRAEKVTVR